MIKSFSLVGTHELKEECLLCIMSIRAIYPNVPILLFTDTITRNFLDSRVKDVAFDLFCDPRNLQQLQEQYSSVAVANRFHRVDCIAAKMHCIKQATALYGDTFFIDSDIIFLDEVHNDIKNDVTLSPHYHVHDRLEQTKKYGVYNAGYLYASNGYVGTVWDEIYKHRSTFFEQEGMIYFNQYMDVHHFDRTHNIGFWRAKVYYKDFPFKPGPYIDITADAFDGAKSLHVHMTKFYEARADAGLTKVYDLWMAKCDEVIKVRAKGLLEDWQKKI
jgi:hypothetical protein